MSTGAKTQKPSFLEKGSEKLADFVGTDPGFMVALGAMVLWIAAGAVLKFADPWPLSLFMGLINFTIIFAGRRAERKDDYAMQSKLEELLRASDKVDQALVHLEQGTEAEVARVNQAEGRKQQ